MLPCFLLRVLNFRKKMKIVFCVYNFAFFNRKREKQNPLLVISVLKHDTTPGNESVRSATKTLEETTTTKYILNKLCNFTHSRSARTNRSRTLSSKMKTSTSQYLVQYFCLNFGLFPLPLTARHSDAIKFIVSLQPEFFLIR